MSRTNIVLIGGRWLEVSTRTPEEEEEIKKGARKKALKVREKILASIKRHNDRKGKEDGRAGAGVQALPIYHTTYSYWEGLAIAGKIYTNVPASLQAAKKLNLL